MGCCAVRAVLFIRYADGFGPMAEEGSLSWIYNTEQELGTMPNILYTKGLTFRLRRSLCLSVRLVVASGRGRTPWNACLLPIWEASGRMRVCTLNLPPNTDGQIDERDVKRLKEFGALLQEEFGTELDVKIQGRKSQNAEGLRFFLKATGRPDPLCFAAGRSDQGAARRRLSDYGAVRQRDQYPLYQGTVIGNRKICQLQNPFKASRTR